MQYIQRQSTYARTIHWFHTISCLSLFATGVMLYVPSIAAALSVDTIQIARLVHRAAAVIFIGIPILGAILKPGAFVHWVKEFFEPWTKEDKQFMVKFLPYLFAPKKVHMPKQPKLKSGQKFADAMIFLFAALISISGVFMWASSSFSPGLIRIMYLIHDVSMVGLGVIVMAHAYLGAGIFQPYRGSGRLMFGDGKVPVSDALYHWGFWAEDEIKKGDNVVND